MPPSLQHTKKYQALLQEDGASKDEVSSKVWSEDWKEFVAGTFLEVRNVIGKNEWIVADRRLTAQQLYETVGALNSFLVVFRGTPDADYVAQILASVETKVVEEWNRDRKREDKYNKTKV